MSAHAEFDPSRPAVVPSGGVLGAAQTLLDRVNAATAALSAVAAGLAGCVLTWEVIGRYFLKLPSDWQDELSIFSRLAAPLASWFGIEATFFGLFLVFNALFIFALQRFVLALVDDRIGREREYRWKTKKEVADSPPREEIREVHRADRRRHIIDLSSCLEKFESGL